MKFALVFTLLLSGALALADTVPGAPLTTVSVDGKNILANSAGLTVYTYDPDPAGASVCNGGCARAWPPVAAAATDAVTAPFSVIHRQDGSLQLAYESHPLYLFVGDSNPGDISGDGDDGVWHIVPFTGK